MNGRIVLAIFLTGLLIGFAVAVYYESLFRDGVVVSKMKSDRFAISREEQRRSHAAGYYPSGDGPPPAFTCKTFLQWLPPGSYERDGVVMFRIEEPDEK